MVEKGDIPRRIIDAALELAATQGWRDTTLADIAAAAHVALAELRGHYPSKAAILTAFIRHIDIEALSREDPELADQPPRDRLFDVLMRRFDALTPYKEGVRAIVYGSCAEPMTALCGACSLERSMAWMLEGARIDSSGLGGLARTQGLAAIHLGVLRVWLEDETEDMSRTMAALDRRLRRAENLVVLCDLGRVRRRRPRAEPRAEPA